MGHISNIPIKIDTGESEFNLEKERWSLPFSIELSKEAFHIHWQDVRIELDDVSFEKFYLSFKKAYEEWVRLKKPKTSKSVIFLSKWLGEEEFSHYKNRNIKINKSGKLRHHFQKFPRTESGKVYYDNIFQVEKQEGGQYHIHYRNFRWELGKNLFNKITKAFYKLSGNNNE